jgi:hypothetical protein
VLTDDQQKAKGGRPPKPPAARRSVKLNTHATKAEAELLRAAAEFQYSPWSLAVLLAAATLPPQQRVVDPDARARQERALFHLRKIGTNINQLSRTNNSSKKGNEQPPTETELEAAARELRETLKAFRKAYQF